MGCQLRINDYAFVQDVRYVAQMPDLQLGHRVFHSSDGRPGFVIGKPEMAGWNRALVPIAVEGTTRTELWPLTRVVVRPEIDQCEKLGGEYQPPAGFPLNS